MYICTYRYRCISARFRYSYIYKDKITDLWSNESIVCIKRDIHIIEKYIHIVHTISATYKRVKLHELCTYILRVYHCRLALSTLYLAWMLNCEYKYQFALYFTIGRPPTNLNRRYFTRYSEELLLVLRTHQYNAMYTYMYSIRHSVFSRVRYWK